MWAVEELIRNALKFTPSSGIVKVATVVMKRELVEVSISDNGQGISETELNKIFNPFYQVDSSSTRHVGGTGVGLSLAQDILQAHGSEIKVESKLGAGSRFYFLLERKDD